MSETCKVCGGEGCAYCLDTLGLTIHRNRLVAEARKYLATNHVEEYSEGILMMVAGAIEYGEQLRTLSHAQKAESAPVKDRYAFLELGKEKHPVPFRGRVYAGPYATKEKE